MSDPPPHRPSSPTLPLSHQNQPQITVFTRHWPLNFMIMRSEKFTARNLTLPLNLYLIPTNCPTCNFDKIFLCLFVKKDCIHGFRTMVKLFHGRTFNSRMNTSLIDKGSITISGIAPFRSVQQCPDNAHKPKHSIP